MAVFIQLTQDRLEDMLLRAATAGAMKAMRLTGVPAKTLYTKAELSHDPNIGRGKLDRIIASGRLSPTRLDGGHIKYDITEFQTKFLEQ